MSSDVGEGLAALRARMVAAYPEAIRAAVGYVYPIVANQTPIETGHLVDSAEFHVDGDEGSLSFPGPYARYQHEKLDLNHWHGGNAKFLENPWIAEKDAMIRVAGNVIGEAM